MADELAAITGMDPSEAAGFLEMAGGSLDMAVSMYFEMQGGGGGGGALSDLPSTGPPGPGSAAHKILFGDGAVPDAWLEQGFEFSSAAQSRCGLVQGKNGPCGALAALNAEVIAHLECPMPDVAVGPEALCAAMAKILCRCATDGKVVLASWAGEVGGELREDVVEGTDVSSVALALMAVVASLMGRGGCCLLCYSCVLTRGVDTVRSEACLDGGGVPLVSGPFALCGTELVSLMLCGVARCNVSAYEALSGGKVSWRTRGAVGLLSADELDSGVPLADELKSPSKPVWVVHGGDHFTVLWHPIDDARARAKARVNALFAEFSAQGLAPNEAAARAVECASDEARAEAAGGTAACGTSAPTSSAGYVDVCHWNGLPPSRALGWLRLRGCGSAYEHAPAAPAVHTPTSWRLTLGEVDSVVQAAAADKKAAPGAWREHTYEIALVSAAAVEEDHATAERPADAPPPLRLDPGAPPPAGAAWRCASCYGTRFKTMCFGENASPAGEVCKFCGRSKEAAGWTLWEHYRRLPAPLQRRIDRMSGPKILKTLRTRWPEAEVSVFAGEGRAVEVALGTSACPPGKCLIPSA